jgi:hypothetical protein
MKVSLEIIPYGGIRSALSKAGWRAIRPTVKISKPSVGSSGARRRVYVSFSRDLNQSFVEMFREKATDQTQLLILNDCESTDTLLSRILELQIRSAERCCVVDTELGSGKTPIPLIRLLKCLASSFADEDNHERILDAKLVGDFLHVVSANFSRMDIPIAQISELKGVEASRRQQFEIDEDGSFIYWPDFDLHLGWSQLQQIVDPEAARKAQQKTKDFNVRYGRAIKKVREEYQLGLNDIKGLSGKQVQRIEKGECRLTSNAIEAFSAAHKLKPNEYLQKLSRALADE